MSLYWNAIWFSVTPISSGSWESGLTSWCVSSRSSFAQDLGGDDDLEVAVLGHALAPHDRKAAPVRGHHLEVALVRGPENAVKDVPRLVRGSREDRLLDHVGDHAGRSLESVLLVELRKDRILALGSADDAEARASALELDLAAGVHPRKYAACRFYPGCWKKRETNATLTSRPERAFRRTFIHPPPRPPDRERQPPRPEGCPPGPDTPPARKAAKPVGRGVERVQTECLAMKKVFTTGQVAKICKVAPRRLKWFDSGRLKGYRIPGSQDRRIPREQLIRFLKEHGMPLGELEEEEWHKVLLIGTEKLFNDRIKEILPEDEDFKFELANSGFEAGILAGSFHPDTIIIDLGLGRSEAIQIVSQSAARTRRTPRR